MDEDFEDHYGGKFNRSIGNEIEFLTFQFYECGNYRSPRWGWIKTSDLMWHRFYIEDWISVWDYFNSKETPSWFDSSMKIEEFVEEDIKDYVGQGVDENKKKYKYEWFKVDLLKKFDFKGLKLLKAEAKHLELNDLMCTQIKIDIEGENEIVLNDYCDVKSHELIVNGIKL